MKEKYYALVLIFFTSLLALILLIKIAGAAGGIMMYSESNTNNVSKYRLWDSFDFSEERDAPAITGGNQVEWVVTRSSRIRDQVAIAVMDDDGDLNLNIYNVTNNSFQEWLDVADVGRANDNFRGFGLRPEGLSGNFVVVYEDTSTANRLVSYRTWNGTHWSSNETINLNSDVASQAQLIIRVDSKPNSNELMMGSVGASDDISVARWDGDSWENITSITLDSAAVDEEKFGIEYESLSGDAMIAWGNATSASYRIFDNTTKTWGSQQEIRNMGAVVQQVTLCADPNSDYIGALLGPDSLTDIQAVMWNGTEWLSGEPYEEIAAENVATTNAYCTWTNESTALFMYLDNNGYAIRYFIYNKSDETWRCSENNQIVTNLSAAEGSGGPCTTGNIMADDIETLRAELDFNSTNITIWGLDVDFTFEMFTFNGTHIRQSPSFATEKRYYGWNAAVEPAFYTPLKYSGVSPAQGIVFYGEHNETQALKYRLIDNGDYQQEQTAPEIGGTGKALEWFLLRSSTTRNQTAIAVMDDDGDLNVNIYNITSDTFENWTDISDYGTTSDNYRGFGMKTESLSGNFVIVYERAIQNMAGNRLIYYRTFNGTDWSTESSITLNSDVAAEHQVVIRVDSKPNSNELMMGSVGGSDDLSTARWDGDSWENITTIDLNSAAVDEEKFAIDYETSSGNAMIAWGNATAASYMIFDDQTKTWGAQNQIRERGAVVQQVTLCADPNSNYIGSLLGPDSTGDVLAVMWNGTEWLSGEPSEEDSAENVAATNAYCTWTNENTALFTYVDLDGLEIRYFIYNRSDDTWRCSENNEIVTSLALAEGSGGPCTTGNIMSNDIETLRSERDPQTGEIILWGNDIDEDFETFTFNGTHIVQPTTALLETTTATAGTTEPGYFSYFRYFPEEEIETDCGTLDSANTVYTLTGNVSSTGTCFTIAAENITLDCNGYWINYSTDGGSNEQGIFLNEVSGFTVRNCNIVDGNFGDANEDRYGIFAIFGYNHTIFNTTITTNYSSSIMIDGLVMLNLSNNALFSNESSTPGAALALTNISYANIVNNNLTNNIGFGFDGYFYNSNFSNNNIYTNSTSFYSLTTENSTLSNNILTSINGYGMSLNGYINNILSNNKINAGYFGIWVASSSNQNTFINNSITSNESGLTFYESGNNVFINSTVESFAGDRGVWFYSSDNISVIGSNILCLTTGCSAVHIQDSNNLLFRDCMNITGNVYDVENSNYGAGGITNVTLINCSYNSAKEYSDEGNELIRKWYYQAYANDSVGSPLSNVNITAYNSTGQIQFTVNTSQGSSSGELIINGGFEWNNLTGWTTSGAGWEAGVNPLAGTSGPQAGSYCAYNDGASQQDFYIYQDVNISDYSDYIDSNNLFLNFEGWGVSSEATYDNTSIRVYFLFENGTEISKPLDTLGNISSNDDWWRVNLTNYTIPNQTRYVRVWGNTYETGYDSGSLDSFSLTVNYPQELSQGYIPRQEITEYINTGGTRSYYNNYTIDAILTGYETDSNVFNFTLTQNKIDDFFTLQEEYVDTIPPTITFQEPPTPENTSTVYSSTQTISANISDDYLEGNTSSWIDFDRSLVVYFSMDYYNLTGIIDNSTYNNIATFSGGISGVNTLDGARGKGLKFDGDDDYINGDDSYLPYDNSSFTLSFWINPIEVQHDKGVLSWGTYGNRNLLNIFLYNSSLGERLIGLSSLDEDIPDTFPNTHYTVGEWQHVIFRYNKTHVTTYIDGELKDNPVLDLNISNYGSSPFRIGWGVVGDNLNGSLDELMIFNRSLSETEILALYNSQSNLFNVTFEDLEDGQHNYTIYAIDEAGNYNSSEERNFIVNSNLDCGTLDTPNTVYTLTGNVSSTGTCFTITQPNITLDCNGYSINYTTSGIAGYGVYTDQFNSTIKNCNIVLGDWSSGASDDNNGIYLSEADNGTIFNNYVKTNNSAAIFLEGEANFNNITNNTVYSGLHGIDVQGHNNYISDNFANSSGIYYTFTCAIIIYGGQNNTLINNTLNARYSSLGLSNFANNTLLINNTILSNEGEGIYLQDSFNNTFINENVSTYGSYGVRFSISANNTFKDVAISSELYDVEFGWDEGSLNNTFVNCSYDVERVNGAYNELIRKWYYQAYANSSAGSPVSNVNISAYNTTGQLQFTTLTNSSGLIERQEVVEYINTGGTISYYNNYTINATLSGYEIESNVLNFTSTQNKIDDVFTLQGEGLTCETLDSANTTYTLTQNVSSQGTCFTITQPNITLDCNGYWINYSINGTNDTYGIYTNQFNTTIKNCNIVEGNLSNPTNNKHGIYIEGADNSTIFNNYINIQSSHSIDIRGTSIYTNITNNIIKSNSGPAVYLLNGPANSIIENNIVVTNGSTGIFLYSECDNSTLINNNISNIGEGGTGIYIVESENVFVANNNVTGDFDYSVNLYHSLNTTLLNQFATGAARALEIWGSNNSIIRDCINISGYNYDLHISSSYLSVNNTLINCSYDSNKEYVNGPLNDLIRKWYYQAYVNNTAGSPMVNANILAYNTTGQLEFTTSTNSSGYISRQEITEYINTGGTISYFSNYTINATFSGYETDSNILNITETQNKLDDVFTLDGEGLQCGTLSTIGNTYILTSNVSSQGTCFLINRPNITLDCNGYWINYSINGSENTYGIYSAQLNTTIKNCNVIDGNWTSSYTTRYGVILTGSDNSTMYNNYVNVNNSNAIYLAFGNSFNNITKNTGVSYSNRGIYFSGDNSSFTDNIAISNSTHGFDVGSGSVNNIFINNSGTSVLGNGITVYSSNNNTFINCTGTSSSNNGVGISNSVFNIFEGLTAKSLSGFNRAISLSNSNNSLFRDCGNISGYYSVYAAGGSVSINNTLINCSYLVSGESIASGSELIRKWYYQAYVNDSEGNAIENVNISAYNTTGQLQFTTLTNSSGLIERQEVIEYLNTGGTRSYFNNYTINATLLGYEEGSNILNFTITQNKMDDSFTLIEDIIPGVNACGTLSTANTVYTLTSNVSSQGSCFTITQPNITLDCNNYWINYSINGTDYGRGIYTNQLNTTIKNCNIIDGNITNTNTNRQGIYFYQSSNGTIENNTVVSNNSQAVHLRLNSQFNNVTNNTLKGFTDIGLDLHTSNSNNITNNLMITGSSADSALVVYQSSNNFFMNNTGIGGGYGIDVVGTASTQSNNNFFINNTATSNVGDAIRLVLGEYNDFINQIAISSSSGDYAIIIDDANHTRFIDCTNLTASPTQVYIHTGISKNNSFINCSYVSEWIREGDPELIRKWYYQAYTNYSNGTAVAGANISAYNTTGQLQFTTLTNSSGLIDRQEVIEYVNTGGTRSYYNNYTINATLSGYDNDSNIFNFTLTQNKIDDAFTLQEEFVDVTSPNITFEEPPTPENSSTVYSSTQTIVANISDDNQEGNTSSWIDFDRSLVAYWSMDYYNATGIYDNSTYNNFGTFEGGLNYTNISTGSRGDALTFDGNTTYLSFNDISNMGQHFTISLWSNTLGNGSSNDGGLFFHSYDWGSEGGDGFGIYQYFVATEGESGMYTYARIGNYSTQWNELGTTIEFAPLNTWRNYVIQFDYPYLITYVNGVIMENNSFAYTLNSTWNDFSIGRLWDGVHFNGSLDEVMIFNRSLSETEILALYNSQSNLFNGTFADLQDGQHNYTVYAIDEAGNYNSSGERNFIVEPDTTYPNVTINSPTGTFADITPLINISISENSDVWYNINNGTNITLCTSCNTSQNTFLYLEEGTYTLYAFANDTSGNLNNTVSSQFTINMAKNYYDNFNDNSSIQANNNLDLNLGNISFTGSSNYLDNPNLVSVYEFENSGNLGLDTQGNNNMSSVGDPAQNTTIPSGFTGYSVELDGDDQICNYSGFTFDPSANHTMCFWVMKTVFASDGNVFAQNCVYDTWDASSEYIFTANNCYNQESIGIEGVYTLNQWVHICQTYDSTTDNMTFYINGNENTSHIFTNPIEYHADQAWCIGGCNGGCWMTGNVFEPMWFDQMLTSEEIFKIYSNEAGYNSGNFTSYPINITQNITSITNITWTEINTDADNNITVQVSADNGITWYTATSGSALGQTFTGENNSLVYRVMFATNSSTTIAISDMNISWSSEEEVVGENTCGTLDSANTVYTLTQNVSSQGTCFTITAANVTLDCNGYWINYSIGGEANTYGVYSYDNNNLTIKNCNIVDGNWSSTTEYSRVGIEINAVTNSTIFNNTIRTNNSYGLYLYNNARYNNLTSNTVFSNTSLGIILDDNSAYNTLINNTASSNGDAAIFIYQYSDNNTLIGNNGTSRFAGCFIYSSGYNNFSNNTCANRYGIDYGLYLYDAYNNLFVNNTAISEIGTPTRIGASLNNTFIQHISIIVGEGYHSVSLDYSTNNTIFKDCVNISGPDYDLIVDTNSINNTLINCSYDSERIDDTFSQIIRKWYYQSYTNYTNGTAVTGANISAYNTTGQLQFTTLTNSSGLIDRQEVTEYINTGGTRSYYNNYTINATLPGYDTESNIFNFTTTQNKIDDWFTLQEEFVDVTSPNITFEEPPTPENSSTITTANTTIVANISDDNLEGNTSSWIDFDRSLVGYWSMDYYNATGIFDNSSYGNFGEFGGDLSTSNSSTGSRGKGFDFDETDDTYLYLGDDFNFQEFAFSIWVKPTSNVDSLTSIISKFDVYELDLAYTEDPNKPLCVLGDGDSWNSGDLAYSSTNYTLDEWNHIVCIFNGTHLTTYLNGIPGTPVLQTVSMPESNSNPVYIGRSYYPGYEFSGTLDELLFFNRSLSETEILSLYNSQSNLFNGTFADLQDGQHNYTVYAIDEAGNINNSGERNFIVNTEVVGENACGTLDTANTVYTLTQNVSSQGTCFTITQPNITLDCNGYWINYSIGGEADTYGVWIDDSNNLTMKNCNIVDGNWSSETGTNRYGIYYSSTNSANSTIQYNYINTSNGASIYIEADNINISSNKVYSNSSFALSSSGNDYLYLYNNTLSSNYQETLLSSGEENSIISNTILSTNRALRVGSTYNSNITNNTISTTGSFAIYCFGCFNNNLTDNNITTPPSSTAIGLYYTSQNNTVENNLLNSGSITIYSSGSDNIINNNTLLNGGVQVSLFSSNNYVSNNKILAPSSGIHITNSYNNIFIRNDVTGDNRGYYTSGGNNTNNTIYDCVYTYGGVNDVMMSENTTSFSILTLINCSYNLSKENVAQGNNLIRKWYFDANVSYSNNTAIENANLTFYNSSSNLISSQLTDSNGDISILEVIEYINTNGTKNYETPNTVNVTKSGYSTNSTTYNLTTLQNIFANIILSETSCNCPGLDLNWELDMSEYCNITNNCDLGNGNITFIDIGETRFNATVSTANLEYPSTGQTIFMQSGGWIKVG